MVSICRTTPLSLSSLLASFYREGLQSLTRLNRGEKVSMSNVLILSQPAAQEIPAQTISTTWRHKKL